ncbi:MAG: EMC3/TMCO1 family protein [Methanobacteriaceae archaeon]|nr:EMC3/TMCO1 family protein [Methanobacteriaceae archaeon]
MVFEIVYTALDAIFAPLIALDPTPKNPMLTIFVISLIISLITTIAQKLLVDQDEMHQIQEDMKAYQNEMKEAQQSGDNKKLAKLQSQQGEMMAQQSEMMKMSFKPMIVTFIPILLVFYWMAQSVVSKTIVSLPPAVYYTLLTPIWHMFYGPPTTSLPYAVGWLGWYILCTFALSQILRKYMGFKDGF